MRLQRCRIERPFGLLEAVVEPGFQGLARRRIGPNPNPFAHVEENSTQIIDPMRVVGMIVGEENAIQGTHFGIEQLFAQVSRRIHEYGCAPAHANPFNQQGSSAATILGICRIACTPYGTDTRHAGR
jgi:hypothetical protein